MDAEKNTLNQPVTSLLNVVKVFLITLLTFFLVYIVLNFVFNVTRNTISSDVLVKTINHYLELLINSWPVSILLLGIILFFTQQKSIGEFISKRMISAGIDGVKASPLSFEAGVQVLEKQNINEPLPVEKKETTAVVDLDASILPTTVGSQNFEEQNKLLTQYLDFEKIHNYIFATQIALLGSMRKDVLGIYYKVIASVYEGWKENDEVLKNYALDDYLNFLLSHGLIILTERSTERAYMITDKGLDFLNYIENNKYPAKEH